MHHYLAVLILVISPDEILVSPQQDEPMWTALKEVALALQVVGPHETWAQDFASEVRYVRHYSRMLADAPPLSDADLLPPIEISRDFRAFNEQYQRHLEHQTELCPCRSDRHERVLTAARHLSDIHDKMVRATDPHGTWAWRRLALADVRDAIGAEAYYAGRWPAAVPLGYFRYVE